MRARTILRQIRRWRTVHLVSGLIVGLWLAIMALTGVLLNHQEDWGLLEMEVSNHHLPSHYTDEFHPEVTRLNVVLSDLHSGRFFGTRGRYISDAVGILVVISVSSGLYTYFLGRRVRRLSESDMAGITKTAKQEPPQPFTRSAAATNSLSAGNPDSDSASTVGRCAIAVRRILPRMF